MSDTAPSFFDGDGIVTTAIGLSDDFGYSVTLQSDSKILVAGFTLNGSNWDFALVRYNTDGSRDTSFDGAEYVALLWIAGQRCCIQQSGSVRAADEPAATSARQDQARLAGHLDGGNQERGRRRDGYRAGAAAHVTGP